MKSQQHNSFIVFKGTQDIDKILKNINNNIIN